MSSPSIEPVKVDDARLLARVWDWAGQAVEPIDAVGIARSAVATGATLRPSTHLWPTSLPLRMVIGLAALLLVGLGIAFAAATIMRPTSPSDAYRAIVVRPVDGGVDVVLAEADGRERLLRHVTTESVGIDPRYTLPIWGSTNQHGWLQLSAYGDGPDLTGLARWGLDVLIDLADPSRAPIILPANGFESGQWGPDGRYALFCGADCKRSPALYTQATEKPGFPYVSPLLEQGQVRVLDLDGGLDSEVIVPNAHTFGGGPDIFWTADGSGFLAHDGQGWGTTPIDGGPIVHGLPKLLSREQYATVPDLDKQYATVLGINELGQYVNDEWQATEPDSATSVAVQRSADWATVWQLLVDTHRTSPRAVLARRAGPGAVDTVHTFDLPADLGWANQTVEGQDGSFVVPWFTLAPDDTFVALHDTNVDRARFVLAPLTAGDQVAATGPVIEGSLAGLVPAADADAWLGQ